MADEALFPQQQGEQPPLLPENVPQIPEYPEGFLLRVIDAATPPTPGEARPMVEELTMHQILYAAQISKEHAQTARQHRMYQEIYRSGYLRLQENARDPALDPSDAAAMRNQAADLRSLMYYHLHQAFPEERQQHITELEWPKREEDAA